MQSNLFKRLGALVLGCIITLSLSVTAFAAETKTEPAYENAICVAPHSTISVNAGPIVGATLSAWEKNKALYPYLGSSGFNKSIRIVTSTDSGSGNGYATFELRDPSGNLVSNNEWMQSVDVDWTYDLGVLHYAQSGEYTLTVSNFSDVTLVVTAQWL